MWEDFWDELDWNWLQRLPVTSFAAGMGLCGIGLAWRRAHEVLGLPAFLGELILWPSLLAVLVLAGLYAAKSLQWRELVVKEFNHPLKINYFAAISTDLILQSATLAPYSTGLAQALWLVAATAQLGFAVVLVGRWITRPTEIAQINPTWLFPAVGNLVAPIAGVGLGFVELSWLFFAIGLFTWLMLLPIVAYRIIFHGGLPVRLAPSLFMLIAPPSVGFLAYHALTAQVIDGAGRMLVLFGLFLGLVLLGLARLFVRVPFGTGWWAATFPCAALAEALLAYHGAVGLTATAILALITLLGSTAIVGLIAVRTVQALAEGTLLVPE